MNVLVDTPVWLLALRRKPEHLSGQEQRQTHALAELIRDGRAQIMGVIRQELLSGIREAERFEKLREHLRAFPNPRWMSSTMKMRRACTTSAAHAESRGRRSIS